MRTFEKNSFFWKTMKLCDRNFEGDDDKVLQPVVDYLSEKDDSVIFQFDDELWNLLHSLDTEKIIERYTKNSDFLYASDDCFLYWRCFVLLGGKKYYNAVKTGKNGIRYNCEFEALLYVARNAWAKKHNAEAKDYPHFE